MFALNYFPLSSLKKFEVLFIVALLCNSRYEVLRFLLSNLRWYIEEYGFDGFRYVLKVVVK